MQEALAPTVQLAGAAHPMHCCISLSHGCEVVLSPVQVHGWQSQPSELFCAWLLWRDVVRVPGSSCGWLGPELTESLVCELGWFRLVALGDLVVTTPSS